MNILTLRTEPNGIMGYRLMTPAEALVSKYPTEVSQEVIECPVRLAPTKLQDLWSYADVVWTHALAAHKAFPDDLLYKMQYVSRPFLHLLEMTYRFPPPVILDLDDDFENIPPFNPAYQHWGNRELLDNPQDYIGKTFSLEAASGTTHPLWYYVEEDIANEETVDGVRVVSVGAVKRRHAHLKELVMQAARIYTTNAYLAKRIQAMGRKDVHILPNLLQRKHYPQIKLSDPDGKVNILWKGGYSHYDNLHDIAYALAETVKKNPNCRVIFWGQPYEGITSLLPPEQYHHEPWVPYDAYSYRLATFYHDIAICPLLDNEFSRSKSPIKWYESSAIANPAATLAANVGPFKEEMVDGETGLLYNTPEEFGQKLDLLIRDAELRQRLGAAAHKWVWDNRDAADWAPVILKDLHEVVADHASRLRDKWGIRTRWSE